MSIFRKFRNDYSKWLVAGIVVAFLSGCATAKKSKSTEASKSSSVNAGDTPSSNQNGSSELYGPPEPATTYGPEPVQVRPLVLVLGPGLARGYAYIGVFQALQKEKIPIGAIYGTEMGGLIGTIYALSNNINQFEWGLLKLKDDAFQENQGFLSKLRGGATQGQKLQAQLKQVVGTKDIHDSKIPVRVTALPEHSTDALLLDHGNAVQVIRSTMAVPGLFGPGTWTDSGKSIQLVSAGNIRPFPINDAKNLGIGPVLAIDVLSEKESAVALDELKGADLVIKPDLGGIGPKDFQKKTDAAFRGKSAIIQHIGEIRHLVGLPEKDGIQ